MIKKIFCLFILLNLILPCSAGHYVKGYMRKDGTYVQGHYKSSLDSSKLNNYSTKGNINPYTGKKGTKRNFNKYLK